jgi:hypothetical protein
MDRAHVACRKTPVFRSDGTRFLVRVRGAECVVMLQEEHTWQPLTHPAHIRISTRTAHVQLPTEAAQPPV